MRKKNSRAESGQAIVELAVSIVVLMLVMLAVMFFAVVGKESVKNLVRAREKADERALSSVSGSTSAENIRRWDYGDDEIPFTADDKAVGGSGENGEYFVSQTVAVDPDEPNMTLDLRRGGPDENNFIGDLPASSLFLFAAELTEGKETMNDPLGENELDDLEPGMDFVGLSGGIKLKDVVFLPVRGRSRNEAQ